MDIQVLRIGQRLIRDDRVTTHVALVARAFGASKIYMNEINPEILDTLNKINDTWGGKFTIEFIILDIVYIITMMLALFTSFIFGLNIS